MFTFRCTGCGKQHVVNKAFEAEYSTRCLRCGATIKVTPGLVHAAARGAPTAATSRQLKEAITARRPTATGGATAPVKNGATEEPDEAPKGDVPLADAGLADAIKEDAAGPSAQAVRGRATGGAGGDGDSQPTYSVADGKPSPSPEPYPESATQETSFWRKRWPMMAGIAALVLVLAGAGGYFFFIRDTKKPAPVSKAPPKKTSTQKELPATTEKEPEKPAEQQAPAKPKEPEIIHISAPRLAAELATNADEANQKYKERILEVSGLFDRMDLRESINPPARWHVVFAGPGPAICCDLQASPTPVPRWQGLTLGMPFTVRGIYSSKGFLHACELLPSLVPSADSVFKGQEVEVAGTIRAIYLRPERQYPTIRLDGDTDSLSDLECVFRISEEEEVQRARSGILRAGLPVTIRGTCSGRITTGEGPSVRLDNCRLVYTSAPAPPAARYGAVEFLRRYEEDIRPFFLPAPGSEERVAEPLAAAQLHKEWAADAKAFDKKYRNKVVTISGKWSEKVTTPGQAGGTVMLVSGNTDQPIRVRCLFDMASFQELKPGLKEGDEFLVRGRWSGLSAGPTIRLDSCQDPGAAARDPRWVTPDYLPHQAGRQLTYDIADFPALEKQDPMVKRVMFLQREPGKDGSFTELLITHQGPLPAKSLFAGAEADKWPSQKRTKKMTPPGLPGPILFHRLSAGFIEIGHIEIGRDGRRIVWEPLLKLGSRAGDSWKWPQGNETHDYVIEKFEERDGRSCVIVKETITHLADPTHPGEVSHVYARDLGELEMRGWVRVTSKERRIIKEMKLVENPEKAPEKPVPPIKGP